MAAERNVQSFLSKTLPAIGKGCNEAAVKSPSIRHWAAHEFADRISETAVAERGKSAGIHRFAGPRAARFRRHHAGDHPDAVGKVAEYSSSGRSFFALGLVAWRRTRSCSSAIDRDGCPPCRRRRFKPLPMRSTATHRLLDAADALEKSLDQPAPLRDKHCMVGTPRAGRFGVHRHQAGGFAGFAAAAYDWPGCRTKLLGDARRRMTGIQEDKDGELAARKN